MWLSRFRSASLFFLLLSAGWLLLSSPVYSDVVLTDQEAADLDEILTTLEKRSTEQAESLNTALTELAEAQSSLEKARTSYDAREKEWAESLRKTTLVRDIWAVTTVATGVVGILAVVVTLVVRR